MRHQLGPLLGLSFSYLRWFGVGFSLGFRAGLRFCIGLNQRIRCVLSRLAQGVERRLRFELRRFFGWHLSCVDI